ncbi:MAG: undecaprenyl-diphosphate phosphatase [Jatrophihabitans sp.]|uniref:undecaprenyl-diphosphate phosphatase n=1 Tax=Jatrophihabitans sp. TaxID=1932789 RepID=UPI003F7DE5A9
MLSYLQAVVIGLLQGVTELFPVSSLGHSVLVPAWIGGSWNSLVTQSATGNSGSSPYLAFIVALHVATALALVLFFRHDWVRIIRGLLRTLRPTVQQRRIVARDADERLAWLLVIATIPVGITGLALEHTFRTRFAKPLAAAVFLAINGLILLAGEALRRRAPIDPEDMDDTADAATGGPSATPGDGGVAVRVERPARRLATLHYGEGAVIGAFQTLALLAGISRSGITMVGGLLRGLSHRDAARFSFLLATPVILAAGVLKLPDLAGAAGKGIHGQVLVGFVVAGVAAYAAVRWLTRWFETRTLTPFAIYCLVAGAASIVRFA